MNVFREFVDLVNLFQGGEREDVVVVLLQIDLEFVS